MLCPHETSNTFLMQRPGATFQCHHPCFEALTVLKNSATAACEEVSVLMVSGAPYVLMAKAWRHLFQGRVHPLEGWAQQSRFLAILQQALDGLESASACVQSYGWSVLASLVSMVHMPLYSSAVRLPILFFSKAPSFVGYGRVDDG